MSSIGHMDVCRCGDDLDDYAERLEQYFIANEIGSLAAGVDDTAEARESAQRKKVATFLTLVGPEAYRLLKSLISPAIPASKTFPELIEVLGNHLKPKKLIVAERFRFHQRNQNEGEPVAQFEAALRKLASTCEFELFLNQALRDQFVCGIRSETTQKKLLCVTERLNRLCKRRSQTKLRKVSQGLFTVVKQITSDNRRCMQCQESGTVVDSLTMVTVNTQHRSCKVNTKFHSINKSVFGVMAITWVTNVVFVTPYVMRVDVQDTSKGHAEKGGNVKKCSEREMHCRSKSGSRLFAVFTVNTTKRSNRASRSGWQIDRDAC